MTKVMLTLQIQKEVTVTERNKYIRELERDGWDVNIQSEEGVEEVKEDREATQQVQERNLLRVYRDLNNVAKELNRLHALQLHLITEQISIERWFINNELQIPKRRT